jgi:excisionase family DNA binding protein
MTMDDGTTLLLPEEAASLLQVPVSWLYAAAREGRFPCVRVGRYVRFRRADVENYIAEGGAA